SRRHGFSSGRRRSRGRSRSERRRSSAASTRTHRRSATTCSRPSRTRASSCSSGRPAGSGRSSSAHHPEGAGRPAGPLAPRSPRTHVNEILLFLLLGLGTGATIAAIAVGIVVTYRGSGFINLAAGAIAMLAGFSFWALRTGELGFTLSTPLAGVFFYAFVLVASVALDGLFLLRVRALRERRHRARRLPSPPHRGAAREARRVARRAAHVAGGD